MRALGIILAGGNNNKMRELSNKRAVAAMPVAGSFRSIDFALSSMANSHIQKVAVLTQYNARSLNEHLRLFQMVGFRKKTWRSVCIFLQPLHQITAGLVPWNGRRDQSEPGWLKNKP